MAKAIAFMLLVYLFVAIGVGIIAGGGGVAATDLTVAVDDDDVTLQVTSTSNFLSADYIELGNEKVFYTGTTDTTFTGCTRGYDGTTAASHVVGTMVYTTSASVINSAMGFNVAATVDSMGLWSIVTIPFYFFVRTLPNLMLMPYQLFTGDLVIVAIIMVCIQAAVVIVLAISFTGARRV